MLNWIIIITRESNKNIYELMPDNLCMELKERDIAFTKVYEPSVLEEKWLYKESLVITDDAEYFKAVFKARGNVLFLSLTDVEANTDIPWDAEYVLEGVESLTYENLLEGYEALSNISRTILETNRLVIRESTVEDVDAFYRIYAAPGMTDYTDDLFKDPEDEKRYMASYIREIYGFYGFGVWSVILKETGEVIGRAGLSAKDGYESLELGYIIDKKYQNLGIATEACEAIILYAKDKLMASKIHALTNPNNKAGIRLLEKLNFREQGEVKEDAKIYTYFCRIL